MSVFADIVRRMVLAHEERVENDHWIKCPLCMGYTTFDSSDELFQFQLKGYCRCGHKFGSGMETGTYPRGKILIWDERLEPG